jgi:hypothetical protein
LPIAHPVALLICRIQNLLRHSKVLRHNSTTLNECCAMKRFLLMSLGLGLNAAPAMAAPTCVEVTPPPNIPIVKQYSDLQRLNGQIVILTGRYQKVVSGPPLLMSPIEKLTLPKPAAISPTITPRSSGFATIVLNDGWAIAINPKGKHSLRTPEEMVKYGGQSVQIQGRARWWGGNNVRSAAGINIYLMRLACGPAVITPKTIAPASIPAPEPTPESTLVPESPPTAAPLTTPTFQPDIPFDPTP